VTDADEFSDDESTDAELDDVEDFSDDESTDDEVDPNRKPAATAAAVLGYLVKSVVDEPDGVEVTINDDRIDRVRLDVHVAPGDMGRVIGRRGRVANAIRTVVRAAAVRDDVEVDVEFVD
jgi:uncharacterized protein